MDSLFRSLSLRRLTILLLGGVALVASVKFAALLYHETLGSYDRDVNIYLTVGRGMLNGLTPYRDLFETKAPGIFLLSALSLWLFNGATLLLWVEAALLTILPLIILLPLFRTQDLTRTIPVITVGFLFSVFLTLYTGAMAGQGLSESFGAVFATAVVALIALPRRGDSDVSAGMTILIAFLLFFAAFFKEPFVLSALGGVVIVSPSFTI